MAKTYKIGEYSRRFLDALDAFQVFKNSYLDALTSLYDEEQGARLFADDADKLDDVERAVMDYLRICFTEALGATQDAQAVTI